MSSAKCRSLFGPWVFNDECLVIDAFVTRDPFYKYGFIFLPSCCLDCYPLQAAGTLRVLKPVRPPGLLSLDQMLPARIQEEALNCHPTVDSRHRPLQRHGRGHSHRLHHPGLQQGIRQGRPRTPADQTPPRGRRRQPSAMDEIISHRTNTEGLHRWRRILSMRCHIWRATRQRPGPPSSSSFT